jgi:hypothetical protein
MLKIQNKFMVVPFLTMAATLNYTDVQFHHKVLGLTNGTSAVSGPVSLTLSQV